MATSLEARAPAADRATTLQIETLGQLVGQLAHDFNNLLAAALVGVELATEGSDGRSQALLTSTLDTLGRQRELTDAMSRAARACVESQVVDLHALLEDCRDTLEAAVSPLGLDYRLEAHAAAVCCDATFVQRALLHIANNARAAGGEGGTLRIETRNEPARDGIGSENGRLVLSARDDGAGMAEPVRARAFDLFYTTHGAPGLGLPQVRDTMRRAGGTALLESREGQGTCVQLSFPLPEHPDARHLASRGRNRAWSARAQSASRSSGAAPTRSSPISPSER
jgi:signal transduction histidine kinase